MSTKRRVHQVAKEFSISIDALTSFLTRENFDVKSPMSLVTDEMYEEVRKRFFKDLKIVGVDEDIKQRLKEKKAIEEEKKRKDLLEYAERVKVSSRVMTEIPRRRKGIARRESIAEKTAIEVEDITLPEVELFGTKESEPVVESYEKAAIPRITLPTLESESLESAVVKEKAPEASSIQEINKSNLPEPAVPSTLDLPKEAEEIEKIMQAEALPESVVERERIIIEKSEPKRETEKELELKVIRKIDAKKKERVSEKKLDALSPQHLKKKLKKKDRLALAKKSIAIKKAELTEEFVPKKKKKKKKRLERLEIVKELIEKPKRKLKKKKKFVISDEEVEESIRQTFAAMEETAHKRRRKKIKEVGELEIEENNVLRVNEFITVAELAKEMKVESHEVIKKCMELGMLVTINQRLDVETIQIVADEFGYQVEIIPEYGSDLVEELEVEEDDALKLQSRSPVVTIMGHVDHGKTSLLDYIRKSNIIQTEAGGITQHIGAYRVNVDSKMITFLDTPGHEAFTAMRARGAQATDIVVLVVAADDSVMPQTVEAIDHAKAANVPIIVAINKIDKANSNATLIKQQLAEHGVLIEDYGGKYQCVEVSAKTGQGVNRLLESILIEAEILELKADPDRLARGVVIESKLDKGKGVLATVLIQKGTLKVGDPFIVGQYYGKVRGLFDEFGNKQIDAGPSVPVQVIGFTGLPQAGDKFIVFKSEKDTRNISLERQQLRKEKGFRYFHHMTLDEISKRIKAGAVKELSLVIKGDVDGSVEAINDSLLKLSNDEVTVKIIRKSVGGISESDVLLASASDAIIIGFQVRPTVNAREIAKKENVDIRLYKVIYDAIADVKNALEGLLEPTYEEENLGTIEVRNTFKIPKVGMVAGSYVLSGKVSRNDLIRLYREDKLIYEGKLNSLKRFKDDVKEVVAGYECGIGLENFDDIKIADVMEAYQIIAVKRTLALN